jgi:hypothetical protein
MHRAAALIQYGVIAMSTTFATALPLPPWRPKCAIKLVELVHALHQKDGVKSGNPALILRRLLSLSTSDRPTDRTGVDAELRHDRFQRVGTGDICRCHGRPFVTVYVANVCGGGIISALHTVRTQNIVKWATEGIVPGKSFGQSEWN